MEAEENVTVEKESSVGFPLLWALETIAGLSDPSLSSSGELGAVLSALSIKLRRPGSVSSCVTLT